MSEECVGCKRTIVKEFTVNWGNKILLCPACSYIITADTVKGWDEQTRKKWFKNAGWERRITSIKEKKDE